MDNDTTRLPETIEEWMRLRHEEIRCQIKKVERVRGELFNEKDPGKSAYEYSNLSPNPCDLKNEDAFERERAIEERRLQKREREGADRILKMGLLDSGIGNTITRSLLSSVASEGDAWFVTVTFKTPRYPHQAMDTLRSVAETLNLHGVDSGFIGTELHALGTLHVHGVVAPAWGLPEHEVDSMGATGKTRRTQLYRDLFWRFGRSEVRQVYSLGAVIAYCSKYVTKSLTEYLYL